MSEFILNLLFGLVLLTVKVVDGIMSIFSFLHSAERHLSESSRLGDSPLDREARSWQKRVLDIWHWIGLAFILIAILIGILTRLS